uniref:NADH-ubiquinone oxidoreductase chain 3 n=1 Tax=Derodontidae sp. BMNH 899913 TaxID=1903806 RepID=A0A343A4G3_9COLE|nr:NADH dehydrogenase subunit 3 [Derodontidae sp. BMNH 899913]
MIFFLALIIMILVLVMIMLVNLISKKSIIDREKSSPFECGFDPKSSTRMPFSLHFFMIAIIFLIFDVEITLLFPIILTIKFSSMMNFLLISLITIMLLILGLLHEWKQGALNWT